MQRTDLLDMVEIISAGVSELVKKQIEGWAYILPEESLRSTKYNKIEPGLK